jgi:serine/threonine protein kinase
MELRAEEFVAQLVQSRLFDEQSARSALATWRTVAGAEAGDAVDWRRWLVEQKLLTEYQSSLLGRGHADGFFLGKYKILDRIGRGRMAGVYRASDTDDNHVAIKVLPPSKAKDPMLLARFQREARLSERLVHPNVVRTFEVGAADDFNYLVMEFLEGETLDFVLQRRNSLSIPETIDLLEQALSGLQHIHEKRMVHRDVKPANMMLVPAPRDFESDTTIGTTLKLIDFGVSRSIDELPLPESNQDVQLTIAGALLGTPDYAAPEQARDARSADIRADIYSLGCVGYHLLTGRPPFPDKNGIRQMIRHATEAPPKLEQVRPETPASLRSILERMLAKDSADRFETPADALRALREYNSAPATVGLAQLVDNSGAETRRLPSAARAPGHESDFAANEAPTVKQAIFPPPAAEVAARTNTETNTPPDASMPKTPDLSHAQAIPQTPRHPVRKFTVGEKQGRSSDPAAPRIKAPSNASSHLVSKKPPFRWSTRDSLVFAAGAGTVMLALGMGALLSWMFRGD